MAKKILTKSEVIADISTKINDEVEQGITGEKLAGVLTNMVNYSEDASHTLLSSGSAEHSLQMAGEVTVVDGNDVVNTYVNDSISMMSVTLGIGNSAGIGGWKYNAIRVGEENVDFYLTTNTNIDTISINPEEEPIDSTLLSGFAVGDKLSLIIKGVSYNDIFTIKSINGDKTAINGNKISVSRAEFDAVFGNADLETLFNSSGINSSINYSLFCLAKPFNVNYNSDIGQAAFAVGIMNNANNLASNASGYKTNAYGMFSTTEGRETKAGYAAHAEGCETVASGDHSHAEGFMTNASGLASHTEGRQTIATNDYEHSEGKYNLSIKDKTIHTVGIGYTTYSPDIQDDIVSRINAEEIHSNGDKYVYGIGGYDGTNSQAEGVKTVQEVAKEVEKRIGNCVDLNSEQTITAAKSFSAGISLNNTRIRKVKAPTANDDAANKQYVDAAIKIANNAVQITYAELKSLRDAGKLVPGQQYSITDYTCTTTQVGTKSAGHVFDIIVTADDERNLNEVARVVKHEGDTYFANSDLNAWKIWYCLDNDTKRFAWADEENGKGVIYRMIDEFDNDCPYDFKNIQFYRKWDADKSLYSIISSDNTSVPCYTFSSEGDASTTLFKDYSLSKYNKVYSNVIKEYINDAYGNQTLNNICFFGNNCYSNTFGDSCYDNSFKNDCYRNTFGNNFRYNTVGNNCWYNTFGNSFQYNTFGNYCYRNTFGNNCWYNTIGNDCYNNTFGNDCYSNTFGNDCYSNTFRNYCYSNTAGNNCNYNIFENNCYSNTFGNGCVGNTFGNNCYANTFGNYCNNNTSENYFQENTFGNNCENNSFGNNCHSIKFASDSSVSTKYNCYRDNHFGNGCEYILFTGTETASSSKQVQNYKFAQGLKGISSAYLTIDGKRNRAYETYISFDTDGTIKESIIAEKLDKIIEISYADLVALRDSSKLVHGQQYRITDYTCTTTQANTKSAGHVFDIIVTADDENTLNEEAKAALHTGDEYFSDCNLNAWQIWYCLDNDTTRFAWADATNGKGIIYRMIDEWNNDVPYDFKNIQFYRRWDSTKSLWSTISYDTTGVPCYTFSSSGNSSTTSFTDMSLHTSNIVNSVYFNVIKEHIISNNIQTLNNNCFFGNRISYNFFEVNCYDNTLKDCDNNFFGNGCNNNTLITSSCYNTFGYKCSNNSFRYECCHNSFGNNCYSNSFGNYCYSNTFGNDCGSNIFGDRCSRNTFGNDCYCINFAADSSASIKYDYYRYNHLGDGCQYIIFTGAGTASSSQQVQNYNFAQGLQGTYSAYLTIGGKRNLPYEIYVSKDTDGTIKESVIAEFENKLGNYVDLTSEQTITATKTFSGGINMNSTKILNVAPPTNVDDAVNKQYVDTQILDNVKTISTSTAKDIEELRALIEDINNKIDATKPQLVEGITDKYHRGHLVKIKLKASFTGIDSLPDTLPSINFAPIKYNKEAVLSLTVDDCHASAFCNIWAAINGRPVASNVEGGASKNYFYHANQYLNGDIPNEIKGKSYNRMVYNDGLGGKRRYNYGISVWPSVRTNNGSVQMESESMVDKNANNLYRFMSPYFTWTDYDLIKKYGVDLYQHNIGKEDYGSDKIIYNVITGIVGDSFTAFKKGGRFISAVMEPDGNAVYCDAAKQVKLIDVIYNQSTGVDMIPYNNEDMYKKIYKRYFDNIESVKSKIEALLSKDINEREWYHFCFHSVYDNTCDLLQFIHQTYGDRIWFASAQEVYEYQYMKKWADIKAISHKIENGQYIVSFEIYLPFQENFTHKDMSINLSLPVNANLLNVECTSGDIPELEYIGINDTKTMIHVGVNEDLIDNIEYFVSKYESTGDEQWKEDALIDISRLREDLKQNYLSRLNNEPVYVTDIQISLTSSSINKGETVNGTVTALPSNNTQMSSILLNISEGASITSNSISGNIINFTVIGNTVGTTTITATIGDITNSVTLEINEVQTPIAQVEVSNLIVSPASPIVGDNLEVSWTASKNGVTLQNGYIKIWTNLTSMPDAWTSVSNFSHTLNAEESLTTIYVKVASNADGTDASATSVCAVKVNIPAQTVNAPIYMFSLNAGGVGGSNWHRYDTKFKHHVNTLYALSTAQFGGNGPVDDNGSATSLRPMTTEQIRASECVTELLSLNSATWNIGNMSEKYSKIMTLFDETTNERGAVRAIYGMAYGSDTLCALGWTLDNGRYKIRLMSTYDSFSNDPYASCNYQTPGLGKIYFNKEDITAQLGNSVVSFADNTTWSDPVEVNIENRELIISIFNKKTSNASERTRMNIWGLEITKL